MFRYLDYIMDYGVFLYACAKYGIIIIFCQL